MKLLGAFLSVWFAADSMMAAPPAPTAEQPDQEEVAAEIERLTGEFKRLGDWEEQFRIIDRALDNIWSRNNWDSEPDVYARKTIREVASIPPWELDRRIEKLTERFAERYALSPAGRARLKAMYYRELFGFLWNNAGVLFEQIRQSVSTRLDHRPYTPEQVAEWMRQSEPMVEEMNRRMDRLIQGLGGIIDDRHRARFERDVESFRRRQDSIDELRDTWKNGGWKPADWGLENDPIQRQAGHRIVPNDAGAGGAGYSAVDPATWEAYVRGFVRRYGLDRGQAAAAESILVELLARALDYLKANAEALAEIPSQKKSTHQRLAPIRAVFAELQARLERIPTEAQQRGVDSQPIATE